jgi:hypothetical protein
LRGHSVLVGLVVHAALSIRAGTIIALSVSLLIVVHVSSVIRAGVVWVRIWVLCAWLSLWLGRMSLLRLSSLSSLLGLRNWVGSRMSAGLSLTSCGISRLGLLSGGLGEWRGSIGRRSIVSAESTLLRGWPVLLGLRVLLLAILLGVVVLICMALLICGVVLRIFARGR